MRISKISILTSVIAIIVAIWIQYDLFVGYEMVTGKTRALYGIKHLFYMDYLAIGGLGLLLSIISIFKKEKLKIVVLSVGLAVTSIFLLILEIWRWSIWN
ncbi:MAG: hypothetical protein PSN34_01275 [Urechidicola sp.]|nr:hypothetical protein [Urechidicola sp.]